MRRSLFDKRIPTLLALLLLVGGIGVASYVANTSLQLTTQASPDEKPQNIRITNISDTTFTLTYTTTKSVLGTISYGTSKPTQTALDNRDEKTGTPKQYTTHSITVTGLKPETNYVFSILSGGSIFQDADKPFITKTGPKINKKQDQESTITGTILGSDGDQPGNVLIYVTSKNAQVISVLSDTDGKYILKLSNLRSKNFDTYVSLDADTTMDLIALINTATSRASFLLQDPSVPTITLSQNYDFTLGRTIVLPEAASDAGSLTFPVMKVNPVESAIVSIETPKSDEQFSDQQPKFTGTGAPSESVEITIKSEEKKVTIQTDMNGNWIYRPDAPLEPGEHTITVKTKDGRGILREITRTFIVLAEGSQFTEPSVSPIVSIPPTSSPTPIKSGPSPTQTTPTKTPIPTSTPEVTPLPTEIISIPTTAPSPTLTPRPSIQPTGSSSLNSVGIIAFMSMMFGVILLIFTRGMRV